jgi:hypothetical protein
MPISPAVCAWMKARAVSAWNQQGRGDESDHDGAKRMHGGSGPSRGDSCMHVRMYAVGATVTLRLGPQSGPSVSLLMPGDRKVRPFRRFTETSRDVYSGRIAVADRSSSFRMQSHPVSRNPG